MPYSVGLQRQIPSSLRRDFPQGFFASSQQRRRVLMVSIGVMLMFGWLIRSARLRQEDERSALQSVCLHGSYSEYYAPGELHLILRNVVGQKFANAICSRRITISMPPKAFTDNMIDNLDAVSDLDQVFLFDRTTSPSTKMKVASLSTANSGASPRGIARFHQRFPRTKVVVVDSAALPRK